MTLAPIRLAAVAMLACAPLAAQATIHPHFAGTWELDPTKTQSDNVVPPPTAATYLITENGDSITVNQTTTTSVDGVMKTTMVWAVDGKTWRNQMSYQGTPMALNSVLSWDKDVLVIQTSTDFNGTDVERDDRWSLSTDGKMLTVQDTISAGGQVYSTSTTMFARKN